MLRKTRNKFSTGLGCFPIILLLLFNVLVGAWSVSEILSWFGKSISFFADMLIGLFVAEFSVPVAIVGYILKVFGVF